MCANVALASFLLAQKLFDQIYLIVRSKENAKKDMIHCVACIFFPITIMFLPLSYVVNASYYAKQRHHHEKAQDEAKMTIFSSRPLSTFFLGLPITSIMSVCIADDALVMHPVQVHMRMIQTVLQTMVEDIPSVIVDLFVLMNVPRTYNTAYFYLSLIVSSIQVIVSTIVNIREIQSDEHDLSSRGPSSAKPAVNAPHGHV